MGLYRKLQGGVLRIITLGLLLGTILNPSVAIEEYETLKTVVALVSDTSDSQKLDGRNEQTSLAVNRIEAQLAQFPQFEIRKTNTDVLKAEDASALPDASTALFSALTRTMQDVPPARIGGAIVVTDGQVHDVPDDINQLGFNAPVHGIITGEPDDKDRRIRLHQAPRFGIVGEKQTVIYSIQDSGIDDSGLVDVKIAIDGEQHQNQKVKVGVESEFTFTVPHGGKNIVELETPEISGEITGINNSAVVALQGIRENLRVLLISGAPHAGERTWRNLLKSDASVDLVHFTILRPAHKEDGTPVNELSLIAFPIRELFIEKIDEFDLIIFDRYKRYNILPVLYFDSIAQYVINGGAILMAVGSEHALENSMQTSPMAQIFPVKPTGEIIQQPFVPEISVEGERHPVTRKLNNANKQKWSRWFRHIANTKTHGDTVMTGADENPLLVLDRPGEGRIAMLMSDHVWLWARGFEGGGPHTTLLRRLAHWLMKEPSLEEEAVDIEVNGNKMMLKRQTMKDTVNIGTLIDPVGEKYQIELVEKNNGEWEGVFESEIPGLYRFENDGLSVLGHVGPLNPREYTHIVSTTEHLKDIVKQSGGGITRIVKDARDTPRIVPMRGATGDGRVLAGAGIEPEWIGVLDKRAQRLSGLVQFSLFSTLIGLLGLLIMISATWWREGRN